MIDFHCHLDLYPEPAAAVAKAAEINAYILSVTTTPSAWAGTSRLAKGYARIRTALGLHPMLAHQRRGELGLFDALVGETRYLGEVGLDGSHDMKAHQAVQCEVFSHILRRSAQAGGRVISIHSRRAVDPVLDLLRGEPDAGIPVLHWFSGSASQLRRAIDQGCWFSVGPPMLRSQRGAALVAMIPRERVLTETDGPFAQVSGRPLQPSEVMDAVGGLAATWSVTAEEVNAQLVENMTRLARLGQTSICEDVGVFE